MFAFLIILLAAPAVCADEPVSKLTIDSIPGGADVRISDQFAGYSPMAVQISGGATVSILVQRNGSGYNIWKGSVYVPKGKHITYTTKLYRTEEKYSRPGICSLPQTQRVPKSILTTDTSELLRTAHLQKTR